MPTSGPRAADRAKLYRFKVDRLLGKGGSGSVYRGIDPESGQPVALKLFHANYFQSKGHVRELDKSVDEFKTFKHVNVMRIFDFISGDEGEVLVMEYIDGPSLTWYIENRPWNLEERLMICAQICNGLQYIHDQGFTHHDMKPANVLFTRTGVAKLSDYSLYRGGILSKFFDSGLKDLVTPMYIAPELLDRKSATPRSDIYSLGVTMYYLFALKLPFEADSLQALYQCHQRVRPEHPSNVNSRCPRAVGDVIMRALEKDPAARWPDCDMLRVQLGELGQSRI